MITFRARIYSSKRSKVQRLGSFKSESGMEKPVKEAEHNRRPKSVSKMCIDGTVLLAQAKVDAQKLQNMRLETPGPHAIGFGSLVIRVGEQHE
jgi:hypothetical protein